MSDSSSLKKQRDQFLAFAFASADLFVEISHEDRVVFVLGAAKGLTGANDQDLMGQNWLELFSPYEQTKIQHAFENAKPGKRIGPFIIKLGKTLGERKAIMTGIRMPNNPHHYITLGFSNALIEDVVAKEDDLETIKDIMDRDGFINAAQSTLRAMRDYDETAYLTLLHIPDLLSIEAHTDEATWKNIDVNIADALLKAAEQESIAGNCGNAIYGNVHNRAKKPGDLVHALSEAITSAHPDAGEIAITYKTLLSNVESLKKEDMAWAVSHAVYLFEQSPDTLTFETLEKVLEDHKQKREVQVGILKDAINRVSFSFLYQPVVSIESLANGSPKEDHFEIRVKFEAEGYTRSWLNLAREEDMICQFDLAVSERMINHINFKEGGTTRRFSMNISGDSLNDRQFCEKLLELFEKNEAVSKRLSIEIVDPLMIKDKLEVNKLLNSLQDLGFKIILDDIDTDMDNIKKLETLDVNAIKISSKSMRSSLISQERRDNFQSFIKHFKQKKYTITLKGLEKQEHVNFARVIGAQFGQGYFFGGLESKPVFNLPKD